jgi:hypothetical protein
MKLRIDLKRVIRRLRVKSLIEEGIIALFSYDNCCFCFEFERVVSMNDDEKVDC